MGSGAGAWEAGLEAHRAGGEREAGSSGVAAPGEEQPAGPQVASALHQLCPEAAEAARQDSGSPEEVPAGEAEAGQNLGTRAWL